MLLIEALPNKNPLVLDMASSLSKITTGMFLLCPSLPTSFPSPYGMNEISIKLSSSTSIYGFLTHNSPSSFPPSHRG
jgi:hypothetical protein